MEKPYHLSKQDPLKKLLIENIRAKLQGRPFINGVLPAFEQILEFARLIIEQLEESGRSPSIACRCGCCYCCHSQVNIIPIEALLIYTFVKNEFNDNEISDLRKRIASFHELTRGRTFEQRFALKEKLPCIFLISEQCIIYPVRPSICRSWNSLDPSVCMSAYHSKSAQAEIESSPARNYVYGSVRELFEQATRQETLQTSVLHMHQAIGDCFSHPNPLIQWGQGEKIFSV